MDRAASGQIDNQEDAMAETRAQPAVENDYGRLEILPGDDVRSLAWGTWTFRWTPAYEVEPGGGMDIILVVAEVAHFVPAVFKSKLCQFQLWLANSIKTIGEYRVKLGVFNIMFISKLIGRR